MDCLPTVSENEILIKLEEDEAFWQEKLDNTKANSEIYRERIDETIKRHLREL